MQATIFTYMWIIHSIQKDASRNNEVDLTQSSLSSFHYWILVHKDNGNELGECVLVQISFD